MKGNQITVGVEGQDEEMRGMKKGIMWILFALFLFFYERERERERLIVGWNGGSFRSGVNTKCRHKRCASC